MWLDGQPGERVEPRLALQLVHEAAVCTTGIRSDRTLHQRGGFELTNGLPFVATDVAIHELLSQCTVADSQRLQVALEKSAGLPAIFREHSWRLTPTACAATANGGCANGVKSRTADR